MNWSNIWVNLFGRTELLGINIGFWVAMLVVAVIVVIMNIVFWNMKPYEMTKKIVKKSTKSNR